MVHLPALMVLVSLALTEARQLGASSNHNQTHSLSHSNNLAQWLYGLDALMLPEFFSTDPSMYDWQPHMSGQGGTLIALAGRQHVQLGTMPWAAVRWKLDARPWWGLRVQYTGTMIAKGIRSATADELYVGAGLFVRVVDVAGLTLAFDNMLLRTFVSFAEVTRSFRLVVDVPTPPEAINKNACPIVGSAFIHVGFYLIGRSGMVRLGPPGQFTTVDTNYMLTDEWSVPNGPGIW